MLLIVLEAHFLFRFHLPAQNSATLLCLSMVWFLSGIVKVFPSAQSQQQRRVWHVFTPKAAIKEGNLCLLHGLQFLLCSMSSTVSHGCLRRTVLKVLVNRSSKHDIMRRANWVPCNSDNKSIRMKGHVLKKRNILEDFLSRKKKKLLQNYVEV